MGWLTLALMAIGTAALLVVLGVPRLLWMAVASFLMLGAAGYAWQGNPSLPAKMVAADQVKLPPNPAYKQLRDTFFGRFGGEAIYFGVSDAALSSGNTWVAVRVLSGGVDYAPQNVALWTELGNAIALHDEGNVSPASLLAYRHAMQVAPTHPGPPFFLSLAYVRGGQLPEARFWMAKALELTPKGASYRPEVAERLARLDQIMAAIDRMRAQGR